MKRLIFSISIILIFSQSLISQVSFSSFTLEKALKEAKASNKKIFIDIYASWCKPCKMLDANVFPDKELGDFFNKNFICLKIDGEGEEGKKIMKEFELTAFPTLLFLDSDKKLLKKVQGYLNALELAKQGGYALEPSSMPSYKTLNEYNSSPTQENLKKHILALIDDDMPYMPFCEDYYENYPVLDFNDRTELIVFYYVVNDVYSDAYKDFLKKASEIDGEIVIGKIENTLNYYLEEAIKKKDIQVVLVILDEVFPAYSYALGGEFSKQEVVDILQEYYDTGINQ